MGLLLALVASISFSVAHMLIRRASNSPRVNGEVGVLISLMVNGTVLGCAYLVSIQTDRAEPLTKGGIAAFIAAGLFTAFLARSLLFLSIQRIGPGRSIAVSQAAPAFSVVAGVVFLGEKISIPGGVGIAMALGGVALFIAEAYTTSSSAPTVLNPAEGIDPTPSADLGRDRPGAQRNNTVSASTLGWNGITLAGLAAAAFGFGHALRKQGVIATSDPLAGAAIGTVTALVASIIMFWTRARLAARRTAEQESSLSVSARIPSAWGNKYYWFAGLVLTAAQITFFTALAYLPVSYVSVIVASQAIWTLALAALLFRESERLNTHVVISACVIMVGIATIAFA